MDKKFVMGIAAMAALTLVSCSSDDLDSFSDNSSKNEAISFDGYLGRSAVAVNGTRGSVLDKTTLQSVGFGVFGNYKVEDVQEFGSNLFNNQQVTYKASAWTYSPLKFWPTDGHIDFLAYAPYDSKYNDKVSNDNQKLEFEVNSDITAQKDLLWANNAVDQTKDNNSKNKVKFHFYHALSRLGYTVTLYGNGDESSNQATFTVNKITLAGSSDGTSKNAFYKKGIIDLAQATDAPTLWDTSLSSTNENKQNFDLVSNQPLGKDGINSGNNYLFVIPQDFSQEGNTLYVYVDYTINNGGETGTVQNKVYKKLTTNFKQGKAYTLNLTIGLPIEFDVEVVEDWKAPEDGTGNINIGSNDTPWER